MGVAAQGLEIEYLRTFWEGMLDPAKASGRRWDLDNTLLCGLRLNVLETSRFLHERRPTLEEFEGWILERNSGAIDAVALERLRKALNGEVVGPEVSLAGVEGLSAADLAHWDEHGYVVLKAAVSKESAEAAELAIYEYLGMDREDTESWYKETLGHSIWVSMLRHPAFWANRRSARVVKAEREGWPFPGPRLHWDTTLAEPHHLDVQGILYLADVDEEQGAFSCVPGFHKTLKGWLDGLALGVEPRAEALRTLTMKPIAAKRGDMVLWHASLPHGSSPNRGMRPRVAQYIAMRPTRWAYNAEWR